MQRTFGYQTGYAPSQVKQDPKKMAQMGSLRSISSSFDPFDVVQGYLIDEGYAETEEAAAVIMANMSEEWRESILDEASVYGARKGTIRSVIAKGGGPGSIKYVASGGDIIAGDRAAQERSDAAEGKRAGKNRANAARAEQARKKSIERLNSKPGEDEGDYDSGYHGDDDTSDGKRHYSLSHSNRAARRRRASGR
jgi:F0F1-type ATP synthase epsilon subunit